MLLTEMYDRIIHILLEKKMGKKKGRCWKGYKPTPGVEPYAKGSCQPVSEGLNRTFRQMAAADKDELNNPNPKNVSPKNLEIYKKSALKLAQREKRIANRIRQGGDALHRMRHGAKKGAFLNYRKRLGTKPTSDDMKMYMRPDDNDIGNVVRQQGEHYPTRVMAQRKSSPSKKFDPIINFKNIKPDED